LSKEILNINLYKKLLFHYAIDWQKWEEEIQQYIELLNKWNPLAGLVSQTDLVQGCVQHIEDSLSLIPYVLQENADVENGIWLDIGSGGGFPAVPILLANKDAQAVLVERKSKKAGFLQLLVGKFQFKNAKVICSTFPQCLQEMKDEDNNISVITARGVEEPEKLARFLNNWLLEKTKFLCQSPNIHNIFDNEKFKKEFIEDEFTKQGLRRGTLTIIQRR